MQSFVFHKKSKGGKSRTWYGCYKYEWMAKRKEINLGVTDKQVALKKLREAILEAEREHFGLIPAKSIRDASQQEISVHLEAFLEDAAKLGNCKKYITGLRNYITTICAACNWKYLQDIQPDPFRSWRSSQTLALKTLNDYFSGINVFIQWLVEGKRLQENPLLSVGKSKTQGQRKLIRRALSEIEVANLITAAPFKRKVIYLLAVYTGIRRGEIRQLTWTDLDLNNIKPVIRLRASITKNRKDAVISLRKELADALLEWKEYQEDAIKVFKSVPDFCFMKKDWIKASIPLIDGAGRHCDFHSLRKTFCTLMEKSGVPQRIAQEAMRHSDPSLTALVYTDTSQFNMESAVSSLPGFSINTLPLIVPLDLVNNGHFLSRPVTSAIDDKKLQAVGNAGICQHLSSSVRGKRMVPRAGIEPATT